MSRRPQVVFDPPILAHMMLAAIFVTDDLIFVTHSQKKALLLLHDALSRFTLACSRCFPYVSIATSLPYVFGTSELVIDVLIAPPLVPMFRFCAALVVAPGTENVPVGADIGTIVHSKEDIEYYQQAQKAKGMSNYFVKIRWLTKDTLIYRRTGIWFI